MKKALAFLAIAVMTVCLVSVTAFAHGGHRKSGKAHHVRQTRYEVCFVSGCEVLEFHRHNGVWYCSQAEYSDAYELCAVDGCEVLGLHEHDGEYYRCSNYSTTGHGCGRGR